MRMNSFFLLGLLAMLDVGTNVNCFFKRIQLEEYDATDYEKFTKVNNLRQKAGLDILQYSDKLMVLAQSAADKMAKAGVLDNPIPAMVDGKKMHARALKYIGEISTTSHWMGNYKCYDNFLDIIYKPYYDLNDNCLTSSTLFTEYGYGRLHDRSMNLYVVQIYSFTDPELVQAGSSLETHEDKSGVFVLKFKAPRAERVRFY